MLPKQINLEQSYKYVFNVEKNFNFPMVLNNLPVYYCLRTVVNTSKSDSVLRWCTQFTCDESWSLLDNKKKSLLSLPIPYNNVFVIKEKSFE